MERPSADFVKLKQHSIKIKVVCHLAKHEFGIMQSSPEKGLRFDKYEPHKYNCISVDDDLLQKAAEYFSVAMSIIK